MKLLILPNIFRPNTLVRSVLALSVALMGVSFAQANELLSPPVGQQFYLNSNMGMPIPGVVLETETAADGTVLNFARVNEDLYYADGTTFQYTHLIAVGDYGDAIQPLVFVHPVGPDGNVDTSVTVGFPAQYLRFPGSNHVVYQNPFFQQEFAVEYQDLQSRGLPYNAEAEQRNLDIYLSYISRLQEAEAPTVYQSQLTSLPAASAAVVSVGVDGDSRPLGRPDSVAVRAQSALEATISTSGQLPGQNYRNDPRFADVVEVRAGQQIERAIVEVNRDGQTAYARRAVAIPRDQKFIPVPGINPKTVSGSTTLLRAFHGLDDEGNIQLNSDGQPEVFFLPSEQLVYTPEGTSRVASVTDTTRLINPRNRTAETPAPAVESDADDAAETTEDTAASLAVPRTSPALGEELDFAECRNQEFAEQISNSGEDCRLVKIEDFQLVKSQLIQQLRGNTEDRSVLLNSGVIAVDNSTKMCSKIDITHQEYVDDSRAQARIDEYTQNMDSAYRALLRRIHSPAGGNIGAAYNSAPQPSRHTYSCDRRQESCRLSYDFDQTTRLPFLREVKNFSGDVSQQESIRIYGPTDDNQYLFVMKRGAQTVRSLVLEDNPGLIRNGRVGQILADLNSFERSHRFTRLSEIQEEYSSELLRDSREGHFINSETILSNGQPLRQSARLGTREALTLIGQIRQNKTFYELQCRFNALQRIEPIPNWSSDAEGVQ